jgi:hypothetical protein
VSRNWLGAGTIGAIDTVGEATDGSATGIRITMYQVPSEFRDDIADQATRGAKIELYLGALDLDFLTVEATKLIWKGRVDQYKIVDGGDSLSVEIMGESRAIDQRRPAIKRFTDEYQQRKFAGDKFFEYVAQMTEISILWAKAEQASSVTSYGSNPGAGSGYLDGGGKYNTFSGA